MQQRGSVVMENAEETHSSSTTAPSSRSRHNTKLKVLVRSHAMREESPPRESPNSTRINLMSDEDIGGTGPPQVAVVLSPTLQIYREDGSRSPSKDPRSPTRGSPAVITSSPMSPVAVVLSPSVSATSLKLSPTGSTVFATTPKCLSPTNLRQSPSSIGQSQSGCCSPIALSQTCESESSTERLHGSREHEQESGKYEQYVVSTNKHVNDKSNNYRNSSTQYGTNNNQTDIVVVNLKQTSHNNLRKNKYGSTFCDCQQNHHQNCLKCSKNSERNLTVNNNNLNNVNNNTMGGGNNPNMLSVTRTNSKGKLRQQSSSLGSFESSSNSPCLSRDNSSEQYTDTTGVDLEQFIPETLNRNAKDRALMLRIEQELVNLAKDKGKTHYKFPPMSSYQRMLVHRCAAYFGMDHNIEPTGKSVVVNKTKNTRIPDVEFKEHIKDDIIFSEEPRRSILKRDSSSIEDYRSFSLENRRSKSFEEREEEYEKVRRRIFNREMHDGSSEDLGWPEMSWSSTESDYASRFRLQPPNFQLRQCGKLYKVHSEDPGETQRPCVAKSYSFGGYGGAIHVLTRGDSMMSTHSAGPRLLTKQDSGASSVSWRLSPSSSGYKSQSQMSDSVTPSPTSTPHLVGASGDTNEVIVSSDSSGKRQDGNTAGGGETQIVWAVTDIQNVPKGSVIIDPHTGQPLKNEDGSTYQFDPNNPPPNTVQLTSKPPLSPQKNKDPPPSSPKKPSRSSRSSPTPRKSGIMINSSTSPSLPALPSPEVPPEVESPALHHSHQTAPPTTGIQKRFSSGYVSQSDSCLSAGTVALPQQQFTTYPGGPTYGAATPNGGDSSGMYQHPYYVYTTPYSAMHLQQPYEGRMEAPALQEVANPTFYIPDAAGAPPPGQPSAIAYHQSPPTPSYWNQPVTYYQNSAHPPTPTPPHQRYPSAQTGFMQTGYTTNYLTAAAPPSHQPSHNHELVPVFQNQPLQVVYHQSQPAPQNPLIYPNQPPVMYATQNAVYSPSGATAAAYPPPQMTPQHMTAQTLPPYPQGTPTPNSCSSSTSGHVFPGAQLQEQQAFVHLTQSMQSLNLGGGVPAQTLLGTKGPHSFEYRQRSGGNNNFKNSHTSNKFTNNKGLMGSSQSSTGTNSPATTVIATGFCPVSVPGQNPAAFYRTPPETPPASCLPPAQFGYQPNFSMQPVMFKQVGNVRATTPGTARSSRSPTPAGDLPHFDKQRMPLPPNLYHGMPYVVPADPRFLPGRHQPMYRPAAHANKPPIYGQGSDNRAHKNRKPKTNKQSGLPPSGK